MIKKGSFLFLFFLAPFVFSQGSLKGKIVDNKGIPLENAVVYINNTTFGVFTDKNGDYELKVPEGKHTLIVSFLGFQTQEIPLDTANKIKTLYIVLHPKSNVLDEVVIKKTVYDKEWNQNLRVFTKNFLGNTALAKTCKLKNPKVLIFKFNPKLGVLTATSRKPLEIENKGLGYLIMYDLIDFTLTRKKISYVGYTQYKNLKGGKRKQRKWRKNRLKTFLGSQMHFFRSLRNQKLKEAGFIVHQFKRIKNKNRPSNTQIKNAWASIRKNRKIVFSSNKIKPPVTALDSAYAIINKSKLPKYIDMLYKRNVPYKDLIVEKNQHTFMQFNDYLLIIYTKSAPEENYKRNKKDQSHSQTSSIKLISKNVILTPLGDVIDPLDYFVEGYWAYKQFADLLPLNYQPLKD